MVSNDNAGTSLEVIADLSEEAGLHELVGGGLEIRAADLRTNSESRKRCDLGFGEDLFAIGMDLAKRCRGAVGGLWQSRESRCQHEERQRGEARSKMPKHPLILAEIDLDYSTVTDFARLRG